MIVLGQWEAQNNTMLLIFMFLILCDTVNVSIDLFGVLSKLPILGGYPQSFEFLDREVCGSRSS